MRILKRLSYKTKANFNESQKNYDGFLKYYMKYIKYDLLPYDKKQNYNKKILEIAEKIFEQKNIKLQKIEMDFKVSKILILNSEINDNGGHTEIALRYINAFKDDFPIYFYLTALRNSSIDTAPAKSQIIKENVYQYYESSDDLNFAQKVVELYNYIIENKITTINVNMHMDDVISCAALGLIKKYTNINIVFWNHGDHWYSLATDFADIIITRCKNNTAITPYLKNYKNVMSLPFLLKDDSSKIHSKEEIFNKKSELNIPKNSFVTMTGCILDKVDKNYFNLVKKILEKNPSVYHIFICTMKNNKKRELKNFMGKNSNRFIILDFVSDFDFYIQLADLYIDSFPQGSALTLVDFIKHSKPVLIKINESESIRSFEEYLYDDYEYSCKTADEMYEKACKIINNKDEYAKISKKVKNHYDVFYNFEKIKSKHRVFIK